MGWSRTFLCCVGGAALAVGCKGGGDDSDGTDADAGAVPTIPVVLSTTSGQYDAEGDLVEETCDGNWRDAFDRLTIKFDQVATGLSVFVDADVGWVPCEGSIQSFDCRWGNAPGDETNEVWSWLLEGTSDGDTIDATLSLTVTCAPGAGSQCEPCSVVGEITGTLD